jgi:hypothetical protein
VEKPKPLITITIRTRKPEKWRLVDLETGQVWKRHEMGRLVLAEDITFEQKGAARSAEPRQTNGG